MSKTHGLSKTLTYKIWKQIRNRCYNPIATGYKYYGGVGIKVCKRWKKFENFLSDMGERPSLNHSLDRIKSDKDYKPSNCRWATRKEQARNRSNTLKITYQESTKSLAEWCEILNIDYEVTRGRLKNGLSFENAIKSRLYAGQNMSKVDIDYEELTTLYLNGAKLKELGIKYKANYATIRIILKKLGVNPRPGRINY